MTFDFAPAAVVRAPAWPIHTLDDFGDSNLGPTSTILSSTSFDREYEAAIQRERNLLWERTAGDPRFMKALLLASPSLFHRVRAHGGPAVPRIKQTRHLETALYRYLARACSRPTPNHLWAGVTLAPFGEQQRITATAPHIQFGPDLVPFAATLAILAKRTTYEEAGAWRVTPTLRHSEGMWRFLARTGDGGVELRRFAAADAVDGCLSRLCDTGKGTLRELAVRAAVPPELLDRLVETGVLIGGLIFPTQFASTWEALELAGDLLVGHDRAAWLGAKSALFEISDNLSDTFESIEIDDLIVTFDSARRVIAELLTAIDVSVEVPASPFRCDLKLAFELTLGPDTRRQLLENLEAYEREWIDGLSPSSEQRRQSRRALAASLGIAPVALGDELPETALPGQVDFDAWAATFSSSADEVRLNGSRRPHDPACVAPWGMFIARLDETGVARIVGIDDSPMRLFARHSGLLGANNCLELWVQKMFARIEAECQLKLADLAMPFETNPNILARPSASVLTMEPWGVNGVDLLGADIRSRSGHILLHTRTGVWMSAVSCASAHWVSGDPVAAQLALTGFAEPMRATFPATSQPAPDEGGNTSYAPRLKISSGAVIRARRSALTGPSLEQLSRLSRKARYRYWCALAQQLGWPERVSLSFDDGPPLTILSSSPLGVEAAFQGAWRADRLVIEELSTGSPVGTGNHAIEVVVPFARNPHGFSTGN